MKKAAGVVLLLIFGRVAAAFPDVPASHWAYDAVEYLAARGLVIGYPDGEFKGDRVLTRYEYAMIIARLVQQLEQQLREIAREEIEKAGLGPELQKVLDELKASFEKELEDIRAQLQAHETRLAELELRAGQLEERTAAVETTVARHEEEIAELKKMQWSGYVRLGYVKGDGEEFRPAAQPPKAFEQSDLDYAMALNLKFPVNPEITFNFRVSTLGPVGTNLYGDVDLNNNIFNAITYGKYDPFRTGDYRIPMRALDRGNRSFDLNRAFFQWKGQHGVFQTEFFGGKFGPQWFSHPLFFNPFWGYEGIGLNVTYKNKWTFTIADFRTENYPDNIPTLDDTDQVYVQFANLGSWVRNVDFMVGFLGTNTTDKNLVLTDSPQVVLGYLGYHFPHRRPMELYVAGAKNRETLRDTAAADYGAHEFVNALAVGFRYGSVEKRGQWMVDLSWKQVGLNVGLPSYFVPDSKFFTFSFYYRYRQGTLFSLTLDSGSLGSAGSLNQNPTVTSLVAGLVSHF